MPVITRSTHPWVLWPGIKRTFGDAYDDFPTEYTDIFETATSDRAYEDIPEVAGFGLVPQKPEGTALYYDSESPGPTARYTHVAYSLGYIVTREEIKDNQYEEVGGRRARRLARSFRQTKETVGANVLNRGFNSSYVGADGKELLATDHPTLAGTGSNELAVSADISETALEDIVTQMSQARDSRGLVIQLRPRRLVVPPGLWFEANRILKSVNSVGTANNDVNVLRATNAFPGGIAMNHYLTDADAWFVITDAEEGLIYFEREAMDFEQDNDFDTKNARASGYERYSFGWADWRGVYGSPGS